jgi:hypothetical protein
MTDVEFYESLVRCVTADSLCHDRRHKRCAACPLVTSERPCEYELIDEIRHRLVMARQESANGFKQLSLI